MYFISFVGYIRIKSNLPPNWIIFKSKEIEVRKNAWMGYASIKLNKVNTKQE